MMHTDKFLFYLKQFLKIVHIVLKNLDILLFGSILVNIK
jgi:hypothetical protein